MYRRDEEKPQALFSLPQDHRTSFGCSSWLPLKSPRISPTTVDRLGATALSLMVYFRRLSFEWHRLVGNLGVGGGGRESFFFLRQDMSGPLLEPDTTGAKSHSSLPVLPYSSHFCFDPGFFTPPAMCTPSPVDDVINKNEILWTRLFFIMHASISPPSPPSPPSRSSFSCSSHLLFYFYCASSI